MNRPSWDDYFLAIAKVVSTRSHDSQTKHGCVIVDGDKKIISTGYNGFPHGMRDDELPTERPDKYEWMFHSEQNAILNCKVREKGTTAYVTGEPCNHCLRSLWQGGVTKVVYIDGHGSFLIDSIARENRKKFIEHTGMILEPVSTENNCADS